MSTGRSTDGRQVTLTTTQGSTTATAPAATFSADDLGRQVLAYLLLPKTLTTVVAVVSDTTITLSQAASSTGTMNNAALGVEPGTNCGFTGWIPETVAEADQYTVAGVLSGTPSDVLTSPDQRVVQPSRD